ncbi:polyprenyl synthetase family protein [Ammoniphilus sp. 3BR4]|uniref:polyprenyl synthetase family protein n=1 Tax=Ammoniphilus sp. 3BR4 TaxID=3158265 RepID=UPI0034668FE9
MVQSIYTEIERGITSNFIDLELKRTLLTFVDFKAKSGFPFGELTLLHYHMFGGESEEIYKAAASIESMILALDILDDLQDKDNGSAPWSGMHTGIAMNAATGLLSLSYRIIENASFSDARKKDAISYFHTCILHAMDGQHRDLSESIRNEEDLINLIQLKSGSLTAAACLLGTALTTGEHHQEVKEYSTHIGIAAQIANDIEDVCCWEKKSDFLHKKVTLPVLFLLQSKHEDYQIVKRYYQGLIEEKEVLHRKQEIEALIKNSGSLQYAAVIMRVHQLKAMEHINRLPLSQLWKEKLLKNINM